MARWGRLTLDYSEGNYDKNNSSLDYRGATVYGISYG